ncbi:hypothetical protein TESG_04564 [Trichophyton tonsurans CBS 112818]|uniref:Protein EFR3 n=1 Tax=Trichophyton tonsurans (strain CBS 112818) TaxID=647933 RepID=F2S0Q1_TRIT1|nr:hypothetical protein TESG_04564 [Trichophyton tonsurans CBS 112818]
MHSVRQACRPKHQVLVLKCYPRFQKGVQVVRPNSSELSYLLHYASTRRSKLLKVGAFLEKRAARDVWRQKLGNVQVTMQLLAALIEKLPRDLPLYASSVLAILDTVLQHSNDIAMVEETIPTFQVFCSHQDATALSADIDYINQYRDVVRKYASFTTTTTSTTTSTTATDLRWRNVGLQAIRAVVGSEALGADCIATVQTVDTVEAGDPESASGTAADADKAAEVEAQVLAFRCLEKVFTPGSNRLQIRLATALVLEFIVSRNPPRPKNDTSWATDLLEVIVNWAPVQDRFVVLVTLVEALAERPLVDGQLEPQLGLVYMIEWLLSSSINLIGLSVMDILIALLRFIVLLLHLGEGRVKVVPPPSKTAFAQPLALAHTHDTALPTAANAEEGRGGGTATATNSRPSSGSMRQELLVLLQSSVANLANHVYYTDQVSDMVKTIVSRIRPASAQTSSTNNSDHESERAADESSSVVSDTYFSTPNARIIALKAVKDTLDVANRPGTGSSSSRAGGGTHARHPVPVHAWEGTQWLLRDADREVKYAYVDALLYWLKLETNDSDLRAPAEPLKVGKRKDRADLSDGAEKLVRKALPASGPDENKVAAAEVSRFLQHLHFNIYEIATDPAVSEADILLSHLLLVNLVERLGVNAIRYGLPVIMKLQSYCLDPSTPASPLKAGSLVHGYLSAVVERFTLEGTKLGRDILNEVVRRKKNGLWLTKVQLPPLPAARIMAEQPLNPSDTNTDPAAQPKRSAYTPFTSIVELVSQIETAYNQSCLSPTSSPASSPGAAAQGLAATLSFQPPARQLPTTTLLPSYIKEQMLSSWSREACLASIEQERTRSSSITGSKSGSVPARNHLNVSATAGKNGTASSPTGTDSSHGHGQKWQRPVSASAAAAAATTATAPGTRAESRKDRRQSLTEIPHPRSPTTASSSKDSTVRVNELRRVLSVMNTSNVRHPSPLRGHSRLCSDDASSAESMVTDTFSTSDAGFSSTGAADNADAVLEKPSRSSSACQSRSNSRSRPLSKTRTPSTSRRAASPQTSTRSRKHSRSAADNPVEAWDPSLTQNPILLRSVSQSRRAEVDKLLGGIATPTPTTPDADTVVPLAPHDGAKGLLAPSRSISGRRGIGPPPY